MSLDSYGSLLSARIGADWLVSCSVHEKHAPEKENNENHAYLRKKSTTGALCFAGSAVFDVCTQ